MDLLDRLLGHDAWATTQLLELSRDLADAQLDQPADAQRDDQSLAALVERHERACETFAAFARQVRDEGRLDDTFGGNVGEAMTFGGAILHVVLHDEDHRTEALHILQRLGVPDLPEVDHGLWDFVRRGF